MEDQAASKGSYGSVIGGLVTAARFGRDVIAARARRGLAERWLREACEADVDGRLSDEEIAAAAHELYRSYQRAIASRPRPSRRRRPR